MRLTRAVLLGVAAWLAVVAVGSTAVWLVISQAGEDVGTTGSPLPAAATRTGSSAPPSSARPSTGRPSPTTPSPAPATKRRTWQGVGGYVTAECRGADIALLAATPDAGFAVGVGDRGPDTVEVAFEGREDENGRHSEIRGVCVGGVPRFTARTEGTGGDE